MTVFLTIRRTKSEKFILNLVGHAIFEIIYLYRYAIKVDPLIDNSVISIK